MASGGHLDRLAAEFGIQFVSHRKQAMGRHLSKARKTCKTLMQKHGSQHLRLVLGLMNGEHNRGNWSAPCITAVSWVVLNNPAWIDRTDFVEVFDSVSLAELLKTAKQINPAAPTITLSLLLSYQIGGALKKMELKNAA